MLTNPNVPVSNFKEFLAYARANPGKLNYGTPGNGTSPHIATEVFNREAKVKLNHIPYKGAGRLKDLLGGVIDLTFDPGVGTFAGEGQEAAHGRGGGADPASGFPRRADARGERHPRGRRRSAFRLLRHGRRAARGDHRLNREVIRLMQEPQVRERFKALAVELAEPMTPAEFAAYVKRSTTATPS